MRRTTSSPELIFFLHLTRDYGIIVSVNDLWAISSAGRASALQAECQQFDPVIAHQKKASRDPLRGAFFLPFSFFLYSHITSCIRDSLHFVRRFAPSKCVRCGTSSILLSPTRMKRLHVLRAVRSFFLLYLSSHYHSTSCIRAHDHLRVALLLQMMFAAEPVRSCYRPPE